MQRTLLAAVCVMGGLFGAAVQAATLAMTVQPVIYCDTTEGVACSAPNYDQSYFDTVFAGIGIQVTHLSTITYDDPGLTLFSNGDVDAEVALERIDDNFGGFVDTTAGPSTLYVGFAPDLSILSGTSINRSLAGLAYVHNPTQRFQFPYSIIQNNGFSAQAIALVMAHEVGHNLGGEHSLSASGSLMAPSFNASAIPDASSLQITQANQDRFLASNLLAPIAAVPLSASAGFLLVGLGGLAVMARRRKLAA